jgi:enamine deaminase RidA (YjgF/YER057c/UK114 family)
MMLVDTAESQRPKIAEAERRSKARVILALSASTKPNLRRREVAMMKHYQVSPRMAQAVTYNGAVHIAGQVANNRKAGIEDQTRQVLAKIDALLAEAGTSKSKLVAVNVFLPHITDFEAMNIVYDAWVDPERPPARACVEARLADPDLRIEMTAIAAV